MVAACGETATSEPPPPTTETTRLEQATPAEKGASTEEAASTGEVGPAAEMAVHRYGQIVSTGRSDDESFNQTAWAGMQLAAKELEVEVQRLESQQQADYEQNINELLNQGYNGLITVGFMLADATKAAAKANPDIPFAIVDYPSEADNILGLQFAVDEPSFLAGYLAAGMTQTGIVCTYGGDIIRPVVQFMVGFEQGVNYYNKQKGAEVIVKGWKTDPAIETGGDGTFTRTFEGKIEGRRVAENFFDEGCDIIFPVAGQVGLGSAATAQERDLMVIGVNTDLYQSVPEFKDVYLTSVLKQADVVVFEATKRMEEGTFAGGTNYLGTLANGGVGLAPFHDYEDAVSPALREELAEVEQGIIEGRISTGWPVGTTPAIEGPATGELGSAENPIKVLFVPSVETGVIASGGQVMAQALNEATGLNFVGDVPDSYAAVIETMCASPGDTVGFIPAMGYVLANKRCGVEVGAAAVRFGLSRYAAQILVSRDSDIQSLEDLAGKKWAVPSLGSTSAYLYPLVMFQQAGVEPGEAVEVGDHSQSVLALYNGEVDFSTSFFIPPLTDPAWGFGGDPEPYDVNNVVRDEKGQCFSGDIRVLDARCSVAETAPDIFEKTRILVLSPQIPNDTISFSPDFPEPLRSVIVEAAVEFAASETCLQSICADNFYNWSGLEPVDDAFYDPVRNLIEVLGYTEEDVFR